MFNEENSKNLTEILNEAIKAKNLDVKKLSENTDIPVYYLSALFKGDFSNLPAMVYVRGYLIKIAEILEIEKEFLLKAYKKEISLGPLKTSGAYDKLPLNRYAFKPFYKKTVFIVLIILILIAGFLFWRAGDFFGTPKVEIISPIVDNIIVNNSSIKLMGKINPRDKLVINNEEILSEKDGRFEKEIILQEGINTVEFKVKRLLGKEIIIMRQVIYQPQ
ncbi:helix-turn-helix domain-containing protein [Candidatus Wolfebacteria bacterium]|nr:helix-turn-helix domain-containing protein [Candidatus Wolfebacteria bacterium]